MIDANAYVLATHVVAGLENDGEHAVAALRAIRAMLVKQADPAVLELLEAGGEYDPDALAGPEA